ERVRDESPTAVSNQRLRGAEARGFASGENRGGEHLATTAPTEPHGAPDKDAEARRRMPCSSRTPLARSGLGQNGHQSSESLTDLCGRYGALRRMPINSA